MCGIFYFRSVSNSEGRETGISEPEASCGNSSKVAQQLLTNDHRMIYNTLHSVTAIANCDWPILYFAHVARKLETRGTGSSQFVEFSWSCTLHRSRQSFSSGERSFLENLRLKHTGRRSSYRVSTARLSFNPTRWFVSAIANLRNGSIDQSPGGREILCESIKMENTTG